MLQLASACVSNNLEFIVQWLSDHHGQAVAVDWRGLLTLALDHSAHDVVDCLLQSGLVEPPSYRTTQSDNQQQATMVSGKTYIAVLQLTFPRCKICVYLYKTF